MKSATRKKEDMKDKDKEIPLEFIRQAREKLKAKGYSGPVMQMLDDMESARWTFRDLEIHERVSVACAYLMECRDARLTDRTDKILSKADFTRVFDTVGPKPGPRFDEHLWEVVKRRMAIGRTPEVTKV